MFDSILEVASKVDNRICMVLEWTPEEGSLLQDRPFSAAASVYISREAWETQNHQTFCMRLVLLSFTLMYSCMCIIIEHERGAPLLALLYKAAPPPCRLYCFVPAQVAA